MSVKKTVFDPASTDDQALLLAKHLPTGRIWSNAFNPSSTFGKLIRGLGIEFYRFQVLVQKLFNEMDINLTDELLPDWEQSVGLPDSCFRTDLDDPTRRLQVREKFSKFGGVQTAADFVRVAAVFGFNVTITPGSEGALFPLLFPLTFGGTPKEAKHTIFVTILDDISSDSTFPLPFPLPFSTDAATFIRCLFETLVPANVQIIINSEA